MPSLADIEIAAAREYLDVLGGLSISGAAPPVPAWTRSLLLFGPRQPEFWDRASAAPEFRDGAANPLDRWSKRVLGALADRFKGAALFPFDGPPYPPFIDWAFRSGCFHTSPIGLLVHATDGLMTSLRGALALPYSTASPAPKPSPCETCTDRPCRTSCPVGAFNSEGYDVTTCHNHLDTPAGCDCMEQGCAARRACPASKRSGRRPEQSAFHMRAFHGSR